MKYTQSKLKSKDDFKNKIVCRSKHKGNEYMPQMLILILIPIFLLYLKLEILLDQL